MLEEMKHVTAEPGRPLYMTVRDAVREAIESGRYAPGDRLPSTKALSEKMSVSLVTMHRAMQELVAGGVLRRGQGKGTFVHESFGHASRPGLGFRFGLVFHAGSSVADAYHGQILEGVRQRANELGADLVLLRFGEDWRNECQGYIFVNPFESQLMEMPDAGRRSSVATARPVMVVGATFDRPAIHCLDTDNMGVGRRAVEHLAGLGHRRIAFVGGSGKVSNDRDRWRGFQLGMGSAGLKVDPSLVLREDGWRVDQRGHEQLRSMLAKARPTAVFAAGYYFALDVYSAAEAVGVRQPEELSVVGVDDPPSASYLSPPLTTFRQPLIQLGRMAIGDLLENSRSGLISARRSLVDAQLVERLSCLPLKAGE